MTVAVRVWTLEAVDDHRPTTINALVNMHRMVWAHRTRLTRAQWCQLARDSHVPALAACRVTATPLHRDRRSPQDPAACAPHVKAAVDGLVDAGVLSDDDGDRVRSVTFNPPEVVGHNGLRLEIQEV